VAKVHTVVPSEEERGRKGRGGRRGGGEVYHEISMQQLGCS